MKGSKEIFLEEREKEMSNNKDVLLRYNTKSEFPNDFWNYYINPITGFPVYYQYSNDNK